MRVTKKKEGRGQKEIRKIVIFCVIGLFLGFVGGAKGTTLVSAKVITKDITPNEPSGSDLEIVHTVTKLASRRWIQSFTKDDKYYYYIQMTKAYVGHLRITRVKYKGLGRYLKDHMDLKYFGHATNLDASVFDGVTYLWTGSDAASGSDVSRAVSCFPYKKNQTLYHHSNIYYQIPKGVTGKYVTNVYPAVNADSSQLAVRFTADGRQYYQFYQLENGTRIDTRQLIKQVVMTPTVGDFQGFDVEGTTIYTIEGGPRKSFLKTYNPSILYRPTVIRSYNYMLDYWTKKTVKGAKQLSFREPEGIKVDAEKQLQIMFVSNQLTNQSCNIYLVK